MPECQKVPFADQAMARLRLEEWGKRAKLGEEVPHRVYPCDVCSAWHLTGKRSGRKVPPWNKDPNWTRPQR